MVVKPPQWFDDNADNTPWIKALEDVRRRASREGYCFQHVQAIIVAIGPVCGSRHRQSVNRHFFLSKLQSIG